MTELGVNVDHVATVREARGIDVPDPVEAAALAERNGADGIVVHLRLDRRHIQERDLELLSQTVKTRLNLEMCMDEEMIDNAFRYEPDVVTLVPEKREELTTEGGMNVIDQKSRLTDVVKRLQEQGIEVSLFVNPDREQLDVSREVEADAVELHTGDYAEAPDGSEQRDHQLERLNTAAHHGKQLELRVCAGHGLNYRNVKPVARIEPIGELNIGHSIVSRSIMTGFPRATCRMKDLIRDADQGL